MINNNSILYLQMMVFVLVSACNANVMQTNVILLHVDLATRRAGTREVHNKLEKNRRAHLRECFEFLRKQLPAIDDKKLSNLGILKSALRYIQVSSYVLSFH